MEINKITTESYLRDKGPIDKAVIKMWQFLIRNDIFLRKLFIKWSYYKSVQYADISIKQKKSIRQFQKNTIQWITLVSILLSVLSIFLGGWIIGSCITICTCFTVMVLSIQDLLKYSVLVGSEDKKKKLIDQYNKNPRPEIYKMIKHLENVISDSKK